MKAESVCLATNYLLFSDATRQMWTNLNDYLGGYGCRLVLMSTVLPDPPLPFPTIPIPYRLRDYNSAYPAAVREGGRLSRRDFELLENDWGRGNGTGRSVDSLAGLFACRNVAATVLETLQPSYVLAWDSTSPLAHILRAFCFEMGIPFQTIERGLLPETLAVESRGILGHSDLRTHWLAQDIPADAAETFDQIQSYYIATKPQKYDQPAFGGGGSELREKWGLGDKKVIVFFGHGDSGGLVPRDSNQRRCHSPAFASTQEALMALWALLENDPGVAFLFKPHPLDPDPYAVAKVEGVQIVRDVNPHALIDLADVVVASLTTLQFEAALYDKPVVLLGRSAWWGRNATYEVDRREELPEALRAALSRRGWTERRANARAFLTWAMEQFLIGCTPTVPTRRKLRDFARYIATTALDARHLPPAEERWRQTEAQLTQLRRP